MKLAKVSSEMILKIVFWICRAFVCWYLDFADLPDSIDIKYYLYPDKDRIEEWKRYSIQAKKEAEFEATGVWPDGE